MTIDGPAIGETPLLERERDLAALEEVLGRERGLPGPVVIEGPAGIGKSRLLDELNGRAGRLGVRALAGRGAHLERDFPFGVVRQLFEPVLAGERERLLAGAAASAAPVFEALAPPGAGPGDASFAALHGLYWLTTNLAERRPVAARRRRPPLVRRAVAPLPRVRRPRGWRGRGPCSRWACAAASPASIPARRRARVERGRAPRLPRPLSEAAVARLIADRLGGEAEAAFTAACLEATGGNPLLLRQLLSSLAEEDIRPLAAEAGAVRRIGPRAISRTVLVRLHRLGDQAAPWRRRSPSSGSPCSAWPPRWPDDARGGGRRRVGAHPRRDPRPQAPARFVHPLVRDAIYHEMPFAERIMRHARAAALLAEYEAPPEQIATHLLTAPRRGDPWVVDVLAAAAASARAKGAADTAVVAAHPRDRGAAAPRAPARPAARAGAGRGADDRAGRRHPPARRVESLEDPQLRAYAAGALARTLFFTAPAHEAAAVARQAAAETPPELVDARQALRATELAAARYGIGGASVEDLDAEVIEGEGPGAKMLAAMVSFGLAMTGTHADRCAALASGRSPTTC